VEGLKEEVEGRVGGQCARVAGVPRLLTRQNYLHCQDLPQAAQTRARTGERNLRQQGSFSSARRDICTGQQGDWVGHSLPKG